MESNIMGSLRNARKISDLEIGHFAGNIIVLLDRIIRVRHLCHPHGPHRPMIEQEGVEVVVFDDSKMRILVLFANKNVLGRCRSMLAEERILQIGNFDVCLDEATSGGTLYIKVKEESHFEHLLQSNSLYPQTLPAHCFDLVTISEILEIKVPGRGLLDVFGEVVDCYEKGMEAINDLDSREVILVLRETGVLATREPTILTCVFHGQCADSTIRAYNSVSKDAPITAVVMYGILNHEDNPTLGEYNDATRTFFNPTFPELMDARLALVYRLTEMYNRNSIPILPHISEEPEPSIDNVYLS